MTPEDFARALQEELEAALADPGVRVYVQPPPDLSPGSCFTISVESPAAAPSVSELPSTLAIGYLADEEAAVDEWRLWLAALVERLAP